MNLDNQGTIIVNDEVLKLNEYYITNNCEKCPRWDVRVHSTNDFHIYDNNMNHTGFNYKTNIFETNVQNIIYQNDTYQRFRRFYQRDDYTSESYILMIVGKNNGTYEMNFQGILKGNITTNKTFNPVLKKKEVIYYSLDCTYLNNMVRINISRLKFAPNKFIKKIIVNPSNTCITADESINFQSYGINEFDLHLNINPSWNVSGGGYINETGFFNAITVGNWTVFANVSGVSGSTKIQIVLGKLHTISITPEKYVLTADESKSFKAMGFDADENMILIRPSWNVSGGGDINDTGFFNTVKVGNWTVFANISGISGSAIIQIIPGKLHTISILPEICVLTADESKVFKAIGFDADKNMIAIRPNWNVSGGGDINEKGFFNPVTVGEWTIYANVSGVSSSANIKILPGEIINISINPSSFTMIVNETKMFKAIGYDSDKNIISLIPHWEVTGGGLVNKSGFFIAILPGKWLLFANVSNISGNVIINVIKKEYSNSEKNNEDNAENDNDESKDTKAFNNGEGSNFNNHNFLFQAILTSNKSEPIVIYTYEIITFYGDANIGRDEIKSYYFDFNDDSKLRWISNNKTLHQFNNPGFYTIALKLKHMNGLESDWTELYIEVIEKNNSKNMDTDSDGIFDINDPDDDNDGILDEFDEYPTIPDNNDNNKKTSMNYIDYVKNNPEFVTMCTTIGLIIIALLTFYLTFICKKRKQNRLNSESNRKKRDFSDESIIIQNIDEYVKGGKTEIIDSVLNRVNIGTSGENDLK